MLFRGTRAATAVTRTVTNSEFDHVGIILRLTDMPDVYIVEATGGPGVSINRWDNIKKHYGHGKFYETLVFRHVNYTRNDQIYDKYKTFL